MIIKEWAPEDMPREKLLRDGARNQTTPELLAILLSTGSQGENVVDMARRLLNDAGNSLNRLAYMSASELMNTKGIGPAKRKALLTSFGSIKAVEDADIKALTEVKGISEADARAIYEYFHKEED